MFQEQSAMPIRNPSTANLLIDSQDRNNLANTQSTDFTITKQSNILAGYFTRLGVVEIVLNYSIPNISAKYDTDRFSITLGGVTNVFRIQDGNYTVENVMTFLIQAAQLQFPGVTFAFGGAYGALDFSAVDGAGNPVDFTINDTPLARMLGLQIGADISLYEINQPNLIPKQLRYLDFVCTQITYQQGLKDASTSNYTRDILYRWNLGWDTPPPFDQDGYPINQGYIPFVQRRYLSFPKMVKWDTQQPIGQLSLQVYDANGSIVQVQTQDFINPELGNLEYSMGLLVSEQ